MMGLRIGLFACDWWLLVDMEWDEEELDNTEIDDSVKGGKDMRRGQWTRRQDDKSGDANAPFGRL